MPLSQELKETYASVGPSVILETLEFIHYTFPQSFRVVRDQRDWDLTLENNGLTVPFQAFSFNIVQPPQNDKGTTALRIVIDNVDQTMINLLESAQDGTNTPIEVIYRVYLDTDTSTPQNTPLKLSFLNVECNKQQVTGTARRDDVINRKFPKIVYNNSFISLYLS